MVCFWHVPVTRFVIQFRVLLSLFVAIAGL